MDHELRKLFTVHWHLEPQAPQSIITHYYNFSKLQQQAKNSVVNVAWKPLLKAVNRKYVCYNKGEHHLKVSYTQWMFLIKITLVYGLSLVKNADALKTGTSQMILTKAFKATARDRRWGASPRGSGSQQEGEITKVTWAAFLILHACVL